MLSDIQPHLVFVLAILDVSEVVMLLQSLPSPPGCSFGVGVLSSCVGYGYLSFCVWVVIIVVCRFLGMCAVAQAVIDQSGFACV